MAFIFTGIKVLDLTRLLPGPFCTQFLADLGAEVIKIEAPGGGDYSRKMGELLDGYGPTFLMLNRNKKSVVLNLKAKSGVEVFRRLAGSADIVVESFRPGVVDRLGIGYERLKRDNRKLIYCSLTGYGQDGPYAKRAGHDINYVGYSGLGSVTGKRGGKPVPMGIQAADIAGGALTAAFAISSALYYRERTGRGQYIDVSMLDGLLALGQTLIGEYFAKGEVPEPGTLRLSGGYPVYGIYETKDGGFFAIGGLEKKFWDTFCDRAGRGDLKEYHSTGAFKERTKLEKELKSLFKKKTRDEWALLLEDEDACCSPVLTIEEVMKDPQVNHREMITECPHPEEGTIKQVAFPVKFSGIQPVTPGPAPRLGQHTEELLQSVGYNKKEIESLREEGII